MEAKSKKEMATEVSAETMQVAEVASAAVMTTKAAQTRKKWQMPDHTSATVAQLQQQMHAGRGRD